MLATVVLLRWIFLFSSLIRELINRFSLPLLFAIILAAAACLRDGCAEDGFVGGSPCPAVIVI